MAWIGIGRRRLSLRGNYWLHSGSECLKSSIPSWASGLRGVYSKSRASSSNVVTFDA
jgi:hypothetical protein